MKNKWKVVSLEHFTEKDIEEELYKLETSGYKIYSVKINFDKYYPKAMIFSRMK